MHDLLYCVWRHSWLACRFVSRRWETRLSVVHFPLVLQCAPGGGAPPYLPEEGVGGACLDLSCALFIPSLIRLSQLDPAFIWLSLWATRSQHWNPQTQTRVGDYLSTFSHDACILIPAERIPYLFGTKKQEQCRVPKGISKRSTFNRYYLLLRGYHLLSHVRQHPLIIRAAQHWGCTVWWKTRKALLGSLHLPDLIHVRPHVPHPIHLFLRKRGSFDYNWRNFSQVYIECSLAQVVGKPTIFWDTRERKCAKSRLALPRWRQQNDFLVNSCAKQRGRRYVNGFKSLEDAISSLALPSECCAGAANGLWRNEHSNLRDCIYQYLRSDRVPRHGTWRHQLCLRLCVSICYLINRILHPIYLLQKGCTEVQRRLEWSRGEKEATHLHSVLFLGNSECAFGHQLGHHHDHRTGRQWSLIRSTS